MRVCSSSGVAVGQEIVIININVTSFYPQTAETRKFRLHIVYLFSEHFGLLIYSYVNRVIRDIPWVYGSKANSHYVSPLSLLLSRDIRLWWIKRILEENKSYKQAYYRRDGCLLFPSLCSDGAANGGEGS